MAGPKTGFYACFAVCLVAMSGRLAVEGKRRRTDAERRPTPLPLLLSGIGRSSYLTAPSCRTASDQGRSFFYSVASAHNLPTTRRSRRGDNDGMDP